MPGPRYRITNESFVSGESRKQEMAERTGSLLGCALVALTLVLVGTCAAVPAGSMEAAGQEQLRPGDWPEWRGPNRDGISTESGWQTAWPEGGPEVMWEASVGMGYSSVSVVGGRVYTMGYVDANDIVWCLDADTGGEIWKHTYPSKKGRYPGPRATPTVDGDLVFTLSLEGKLFCLNAADGSVRWQVDVKEFGAKQTKIRVRWGFSSSPLVLGDLVILDVGKVLAFERDKGTLRWQCGEEEAGCSSAVVVGFGGKTYVTSFNPYGLILVDAANGKEFARHEWPDPHGGLKVATPIVADDRIFISTCKNNKGHETIGLFEVNEDGLKLLVKNSNIGTHVASCVLWGGYLYGFDGYLSAKGSLKCLDFDTLEVKWAQEGLKVGSLMVADGKLIILCGDGNLICAEASPVGFKQLAGAKVLSGKCWTQPVLIGGRIYCRDNDGKLVCLDVKGVGHDN